jgi:hypothetical protein
MRYLILTILLFNLFNLYSLPPNSQNLSSLADYLTPATLSLLINSGEVKLAFKGTEEPALFPKLDNKASVTQLVKELDPTIGLEYLLLYSPHPSSPSQTPAQSIQKPFSPDLLRISNALRAVSTLKGIEYYSASRQKMRTFFNEAYVIDSPASRNRLSDPQVTVIPAREEIFIFTNDSTLDDNILSVIYTWNNEYMSMFMQNLTTVWALFIPAIQPGGFKTLLIVLPVKEGLLFYGLCCIKTVNLFGLAEKKGEASTYNRLVAFFKWFKTNYEKK